MAILGYYESDGMTLGDAYCCSCTTILDIRNGYEQPIDDGDESDTPTHCARCEELIPHGLTPDGVLYVLNALFDIFFDEGKGRKCIVKKWITEYRIDVDDLLSETVNDFPDSDSFSPHLED